MNYVTFLSSLFDRGAVQVPREKTVTSAEQEEAEPILRHYEQQYRLTLPGDPPPMNLLMTQWAGLMLYHACRFVVHRDIDLNEIAETLDVQVPRATTAEAHYSVDVIFHFLPDLVRFATRLSSEDPFHAQLQQWAKAWPLSSVGIKDVGEVEASPILDHPALSLIYVDRILARSDVSRLNDARALNAAQAAVGHYPRLAGDLAPLLQKTTENL